MCMLPILIICRWNFENPFNSSQVIQENIVFAAILNFPERTGSRFWGPKFFTCACYLYQSYAVGILKIRWIVLNLFKKTLFWRPFWIFPSEPEVDFENQHFSHVHDINSEYMPLEFWKSVHYILFYSFWIFLTKPEVDLKN